MPIRRELWGGASWLDAVLYDDVVAPLSGRADAEQLRQPSVTLREGHDESSDLRTPGLWALS